ncbi:hypothetical protein D3C87_777590 [compost metagenome]
MAWIEFHQELPRHPKTDVFMDELDVSRPTAVGMLGMGWIWAMEFAIDGFIQEKRIGAAARGAGWDGSPAVFAEAMVAAGWWDPVDDGYRVHDWEKYIGKLLEKRRQDADRKAASRSNPKDGKKESKANPKAVHRTSTGQELEIRNESEANPRDGSGKPTNHVPTNPSPPLPPSSLPGLKEEEAVIGLELEDNRRLLEALKGHVPSLREFVFRIEKALGVSHGDRAFEAWHAMPSTMRVDWLLVAWEKAMTAKATSRSRYMAGVIGSALVDGVDLASPGDQGSCAPPPGDTAPPPVDPQIVRDRLSRQLAPLLVRSGMARQAAEAFLRDSSLEALEARLAELKPPPTGGSRGAA